MPSYFVICCFVLAVSSSQAYACQTLGASCSKTMGTTCCDGLSCVIANDIWGSCQNDTITVKRNARKARITVPVVTSSHAVTTPAPHTVVSVSTPGSTVGSTYNGDGTYYDIGMGACGWTNTDSDLVAAVSQTVYGSQPNPNNSPVCGKCALVRYGTNSVQVKVVDKCMGCKTPDIDMSPAAFQQLAALNLGRISVSWSFMNSCLNASTAGSTVTAVPVPLTSTITAPQSAPPTSAPTVLVNTTATGSGVGSVYNGDGTYYDVGMGACGWTNTDSDLIAAVSQTVYGSQPNPNNSPICGQCALVTYGSNSVKVTIVDKCMGCNTPDIDMSPAAFQQLAPESVGRISISWTFVAC